MVVITNFFFHCFQRLSKQFAVISGFSEILQKSLTACRETFRFFYMITACRIVSFSLSSCSENFHYESGINCSTALLCFFVRTIVFYFFGKKDTRFHQPFLNIDANNNLRPLKSDGTVVKLRNRNFRNIPKNHNFQYFFLTKAAIAIK